MSNIEEQGEKIKLAHAQCKDYAKLEAGVRDPGAGNEDITQLLAMYRDIMEDMEEFKSKCTTVGLPRTAEVTKNAIQLLDGNKAIMEEELAKPR